MFRDGAYDANDEAKDRAPQGHQIVFDGGALLFAGAQPGRAVSALAIHAGFAVSLRAGEGFDATIHDRISRLEGFQAELKQLRGCWMCG